MYVDIVDSLDSSILARFLSIFNDPCSGGCNDACISYILWIISKFQLTFLIVLIIVCFDYYNKQLVVALSSDVLRSTSASRRWPLTQTIDTISIKSEDKQDEDIMMTEVIVLNFLFIRSFC